MQHVTMTIETKNVANKIHSQLHRLWLDQVEVPTQGKSISQLLEEMKNQGWNLVTARAKPRNLGVLCMYEYERVDA